MLIAVSASSLYFSCVLQTQCVKNIQAGGSGVLQPLVQCTPVRLLDFKSIVARIHSALGLPFPSVPNPGFKIFLCLSFLKLAYRKKKLFTLPIAI